MGSLARCKIVASLFVSVSATSSVEEEFGMYYRAQADDHVVDLLGGIPTAVPSGAFGGSEDWSLSINGDLAVSARPPMAEDEAWMTNRHIYLMEKRIVNDKNGELGICITADNPGYDTNPIFSPDGKKLAWLSMAGSQYEADAVSIHIYDLVTKKTETLLEAETDWEYSPNSLQWSKDGKMLFFTADVRSRNALCSIDLTKRGENGRAEDICIIKGNQSTSLHEEVITKDNETEGYLLLTSVQSLTMPTELFFIDTSKSEKDGQLCQQLTHFNTQHISRTKLGTPEEFIHRGANKEDVQSWFIRPAGFTEEDEKTAKGVPLAVLYHGGPQGSSGDDWHYRWNLQYYASMGFAVLAPNFHGSTGFGHKFCRDISTNWEVGGKDTISGVAALLKKYPWIDPSRVVGLGASYGGYLSNWLNGNAPKGMFAALVCHCGTFDLKSSYYSTEGTLSL
mmetsp:Transcript_39706/g.92995  ORF Transcript_39706/g.92995 Transcript_39706/m.92995 type:complete len:451 (-) Transcript_39706:741-2093(-)